MHVKANDIGLGIDAGGTATRWALATSAGEIISEGNTQGLTALLANDSVGRELLRKTLSQIAADAGVSLKTLPLSQGKASHVCAGMTGFDAGSETGHQIIALMSEAFGLPAAAITLASDVEIAYLDVFEPGEGYVVYAGTGSITAFIDTAGTMHRAGGRGVALDDGGGGYWIAREALRHIWRAEDEQPDSWRDSPMAIEVFKRIGGASWNQSRDFVYGTASRGDIGKLALAVAEAADRDAAALEILQNAGAELARLGQAMIGRFGVRPIALSGRAVELHPAIAQSCRAHLPAGTELKIVTSQAHLAAAKIAAKKLL